MLLFLYNCGLPFVGIAYTVHCCGAIGIDLVITLVLTAIAWIQFLLIPWLYNKMHWCREVRFKFVGGMDASCAAGNEKCEGCPFYKGGDCS